MDEFTRIVEDAAKKQESFEAMWAIAKDFLDRGYSRENLIDQLRKIRAHFRELDLEPEEDKVMDLMDCFEGWCASKWVL